ncbi:MAG: amidohydrolase family protein [Bacteroidota bacterium]
MKSLTSLTLFILTGFLSVQAQTDTTYWSCIMGGNKVGFLKKWKTADGYYHEWFQYNDRGRGDSTVANYKENARGFIIELDANGKDYFKKPVFEKFKSASGVASWENNAEKGELKLSSDASYVPLKISAGTTFRHFFTTPDSSITLIPSGRQKIKILHTAKLGDQKPVRLYQLTGTGLTPSYGWLLDDHSNFGFVSDWFSIVPKGYESELKALLAIQKEYEQSYFKELRKKLTTTQNKVAVVNATVFDPARGAATPNQTILIENGVIQEISNKKYKLSGDYKVIDAAQKFVMPGLWDMHVHFSGGSDGILHLACGVTNVRDMGNSTALIDAKKDVDEGRVLGPRVQVMSGFIDGAGPFAGPIGEKINSVEEGKIAVKKYADLGYKQIKLYSSMKPEWIKPLVEEAKKYNLRVSGHIPAHMLAQEAIEAGYDEIQHMNMIFLNFYGKELDTRTPARFTSVAQKAAFFDFNSPEYKKFLQQLKAKNIVVDPTVSIFESMFTHEEGKPSTSMAMVVNRLPLELQRSQRSGAGLGVPNGLEETYRKSFENMLKMVKALYDNGVPLVAGTDDFPGFILHRELENYVKAGIPVAEVLKIATLQSARIAGKAEQYGTLEKNKAADLIIIDGNPLKNISDIRKVSTVIKDNSIYQTKDLFEAVSIKP